VEFEVFRLGGGDLGLDLLFSLLQAGLENVVYGSLLSRGKLRPERRVASLFLRLPLQKASAAFAS